MMKVRPGAIAREPGFSTSLALGVFGMIEAGLSVSPHYRAYAIAWAEDELARAGFGVVTAETARILKRVEAGLSVSRLQLEAAIYDFLERPRQRIFFRCLSQVVAF